MDNLKRTIIIGDVVLLFASAFWVIYTIKIQAIKELTFNVAWSLGYIIILLLNLYKLSRTEDTQRWEE